MLILNSIGIFVKLIQWWSIIVFRVMGASWELPGYNFHKRITINIPHWLQNTVPHMNAQALSISFLINTVAVCHVINSIIRETSRVQDMNSKTKYILIIIFE